LLAKRNKSSPMRQEQSPVARFKN